MFFPGLFELCHLAKVADRRGDADHEQMAGTGLPGVYGVKRSNVESSNSTCKGGKRLKQ